MKKLLLPILLFACEFTAAADICKSGEGVVTPNGRLTTTSCVDDHGRPTRESISLDGVKLVEDSALYGDLAIDKFKTYWIYQSDPDPVTNCTARLYMLDVSAKPPAVFAFGVKNTCNDFSWASWGKNGSVITLKDDVRFRYKAGKLIPPPVGDDFFRGVVAAPSAVKNGAVVADELTPFVQRLTTPDQFLPKSR